jgi:hypothetical protein
LIAETAAAAASIKSKTADVNEDLGGVSTCRGDIHKLPEGTVADEPDAELAQPNLPWPSRLQAPLPVIHDNGSTQIGQMMVTCTQAMHMGTDAACTVRM